MAGMTQDSVRKALTGTIPGGKLAVWFRRANGEQGRGGCLPRETRHRKRDRKHKTFVPRAGKRGHRQGRSAEPENPGSGRGARSVPVRPPPRRGRGSGATTSHAGGSARGCASGRLGAPGDGSRCGNHRGSRRALSRSAARRGVVGWPGVGDGRLAGPRDRARARAHALVAACAGSGLSTRPGGRALVRGRSLSCNRSHGAGVPWP